MGGERFSRNVSTRWWTIFLWLIIGVYLVRMPVAVWMFVLPRKFESVVVLQESPPPSGRPGQEILIGEAHVEYLVRTLDLDARWEIDPERMHELLQSSVRVKSREGGEVTIAVRLTNTVDARDVAAALGDVYEGWDRFREGRGLELLVEDQVYRFGRFQGSLRSIKSALDVERDDWKRYKSTSLETKLMLQVFGGEKSMDEAAREFTKREGVQSTPELVGQARKVLEGELEIYQEFKSAEKSYASELERREGELSRDALSPPSTIEIIEPALVGRYPVSPRTEFWLSLARIPGLMLGLFLWYLYLSKWRDPDRAVERHKVAMKKHESVEY